METGMIGQKMVAILRGIRAIAKSRKNTTQGYTFRGIDDFFNTIHPLLAEHGVFLLPTYEVLSTTERQTARGGMLFYVRVKGMFAFTAEDGSSVSSTCIGEAMDSGDKATNKAMSAALKYALMQTFCVPCGGATDSEVDSHEPVYCAPQQANSPVPNQVQKPAKNMPLIAAKNALLQKLMNMYQTDKDGAMQLGADAFRATGADKNTIEGIRTVVDYFDKAEKG
ncbi:MAG: single-stranded DNA-binding protein [Candidatus Zixiibacteriota bacterium]|nr:MAG: single-stranded DNA-binding protein [candidate division Zixibacteria bacterium]